MGHDPAMDLLVVAKEPRPGRSKTRLCPPCRPEEAAELAAAALADTLAAAVGSSAERVVLALDGAPGPWLPAGVDVVPQCDGPLADRLAHAWQHVRGPALQIGMDTPQVTAVLLDDAMGRLDEPGCHAALGLACDGGWWALGLQAPAPGVFEGVATSQADTGTRQLARLRSLGLSIEMLATERDVDTWDDALAVASSAPGTAFAAAVRAVQAP